MQFFDKIVCIHSPPQHNSNKLDYRVDLSVGYHYLVALIDKEIRHMNQNVKVSLPVLEYFGFQILTLLQMSKPVHLKVNFRSPFPT